MEKIKRELSDPGFVQPHPLLFSWAFSAKVNTDRASITLAILRGQNVQPRAQEKGEKRDAYIYYLNDTLERYMEYQNKQIGSWPAACCLPSVLLPLVHVREFFLQPLQERLRALVASRGSDCRSTPAAVKTTFPPHLFFLLCSEYNVFSLASVTPATLSLVFDSALELDFLFPPTQYDLTVDGTVHSYFGHPLVSRWYCQTFDDPGSVDRDAEIESMIPRSLHWEVQGCVVLQFSRRLNTLRVQCVWKGKHMRVGYTDWIEAK